MTELVTKCVATLPEVTEAERQQILTAQRNAAAHQALLQTIPAMTCLEVGGAGSLTHLPERFSVAAWNVERCLFPEASAAHLADHGPLLVLLSEMDCGMARTAQRNTTAAMAKAMGLHYVFGVEFFEMGLGGPSERKFCKQDFNRSGWHGNAILSAVPFDRLTLIRLDEEGRWFSTGPDTAADPDQPRLGGRMAIAAIVPTLKGPICAVSTHLESNADGDHRQAQFAKLLDHVEAFAPDMPIIIGGDLNTGNHVPPDFDWRGETLFALAEQRGYRWDLTPDGVTTRNSLITPHDTRRMKLDWFCVRDLEGTAGPLLASLDPDGTPLSDHECVLCQIEV